MSETDTGDKRGRATAVKQRAPSELSRLDRFAELLAGNLDTPTAAARMGMTGQQGNAMLQRIRKRLGPQAI